MNYFFKIKSQKNNPSLNSLNIYKEYNNLRNSIIPKDASSVVDLINQNILVDHIKRDVALIPSKKRARIRGKEVVLPNGKNKWLSGDTIRGQIHGESYFGAIKCLRRDKDNNVLLDKNGERLIDTKYVIRRELKFKKNSSDPGFSSWNDLEKVIVNKKLIGIMKSQYPDNSFQEALEGGVYMLDKNGNRVGQKIRHVRCFTSETNPLKLKRQTYPSMYEHKNDYYVHMGDLFAMCKYVNQEGDKEKVEYRVLSLYDVVQNRKLGLEDIPSQISVKNSIYTLSLVLKKGDMILLFKENVDELKDLDRKRLGERFYEVVSFEGERGVSLIQSNCARSYSELGKGSSLKNFELIDKIRCTISTLNFIVRGIDFELSTDGNITFL